MERSCGIPQKGGFCPLKVVGGSRAVANGTVCQTWGLLPLLESAVLCSHPMRTIKSSCVLEGMSKSLLLHTVHLDRAVKISLAVIIHWPCCFFQGLLLLLMISPVSLYLGRLLLFSVFSFKFVFHSSGTVFSLTPGEEMQHNNILITSAAFCRFAMFQAESIPHVLGWHSGSATYHFAYFFFLIFSFFSFSPISCCF